MATQPRLNAVQLASELSLGVWVIRGVKKANAMAHKQGSEELIFSGRYSTPAKISRWLDAHPSFVARQVLAPKKNSTPHAPRQHQAA